MGSNTIEIPSYLPTGTGAVRRNIVSKLGEMVSVADFGALGTWNGTTGADDTAAIQAACAAVGAGGGVLFPKPTSSYGVSDTITIENDALAIVGASRHTPVAGMSALGSKPLFKFAASGTNQIYRNSVSNLKITLAHNSSIGIHFQRAYRPNLRDLYIAGNNSAANVGLGVWMEADTNWAGGLRMIGCDVAGNKFAVKLSGAAGEGIVVTACEFVGNWFTGVSPMVAGSIGLLLDQYSGYGTAATRNNFELFAKAISDAGQLNRYEKNRFENNGSYDIELTGSNTRSMIFMNTYAGGANSVGSLDRKVAYTANDLLTIVEQGEVYFGGYGNGETPVEAVAKYNSGGATGPGVDLINSTESNTPIGKIRAASSGTNIFGQSLSAREIAIGGIATALSVGTTGDHPFIVNTNGTNRFQINGDGTWTFGSATSLDLGGGSLTVGDDAYDATNWNGSSVVPTKNAVRDKIETLVSTSGDQTIAGTKTFSGVIVAGGCYAPSHYYDGGVTLQNGTSGNVNIVNTAAAGSVVFKTNDTTRATLDSGGALTLVKTLQTTPSTLTDAATIATDASLAHIFRVTLGASRTMGAPTNPTDGQAIIYEIKQDATGSRTVTWNAIFDFGADGAPTLSTAANKVDKVSFRYNSARTKWEYEGKALGFN